MGVVFHVDELRCNTYPGARLANAALQHMPYIQLAPYVANRFVLALE